MNFVAAVLVGVLVAALIVMREVACFLADLEDREDL